MAFDTLDAPVTEQPLRNPVPEHQERLILVDEADRETGTADKLAAHRSGALHRAFSVFLIDERGRVLLQQRAGSKYHSAGLWANTCCGHPRPGEPVAEAAARRLYEELGMEADLRFAFTARYRAALDRGLVENELVHVFFAPWAGAPNPCPTEVQSTQALSVAELQRKAAHDPQHYAAWLTVYLSEHGDALKAWAAQTARSFAARDCAAGSSAQPAGAR